MFRLPIFLFIFSGAALLGSANAACGGGGWKSSATKAVSAQSSSSAATPATQDVDSSEPYFDDRLYAPRAKALDMSHFDAIISRLELSKDQSARIEEVKHSINKQVHDLNQIKINSERAFDACNGTCENERQSMRKAIEAAQRYSANTEFEKQLRTMLIAKQLAVFEGKKQGDLTK